MSLNCLLSGSIPLSILGPALLIAAPLAQAQTDPVAWQPGFHARGIATPEGFATLGVSSTAVFNDGWPDGPRLYIAGSFNAIGATPAANIARLTGCAWEPLGPGLDAPATGMVVFDDGHGPSLFVIGSFATAGGLAAPHVARWDGQYWHALSGGLAGITPHAIGVSHGELYVGGEVPGRYPPVPALARWTGSDWQTIAITGVTKPINAILEADIGAGPQLFIGTGYNPSPSAVGSVHQLADTGWIQVPGSAFPWSVTTLAAFDDGSGVRLYAGGSADFVSDPGVTRLARFTGVAWENVGGAVPGTYHRINQLKVLNTGPSGSPRLYAAGLFSSIGSSEAHGVARWDGIAWQPVDGGTDEPVNVLELAPDGSLVAGGSFNVIGGVVASGIASHWRGSWHALVDSGEGFSYPATDIVDSARSGSTAELYASGGPIAVPGWGIIPFTAGSSINAYVSRWNGTRWSAVNPTTASVSARLLAIDVLHSPSGDVLYGFEQDDTGPDSMVSWDSVHGVQHLGVVAQSPSSGVVQSVRAYGTPANPEVYAAGPVNQISDAVGSGVFQYSGATLGWRALGAFSSCTPSSFAVLDMVKFDAGAGDELFAAGDFSMGGPCVNIAGWTGSAWQSASGGITGLGARVYAVILWDDGTGPALYATGNFTTAGSTSANRIAKWDGLTWSALGSGLTSNGTSAALGRALAVFDDGTGPALYAGGDFAFAGGVPVHNLAKWDGHAWSDVLGGLDSFVTNLWVHDDGTGLALFATGAFTRAGSTVSVRFAKLGHARPACRADFNRDSVLNSQDFCDFLAAFFALAGNADINHDSVVNSQDFFDFITVFFAGC